MKVYSTGSQGLWIVIGFIVLSLMIMVGLGSFLFGTPIGWAIITLLIIRHYYIKHKIRKAYQYADSSFSSTQTTTNYRDKTDTFESKGFSKKDAYEAVDVEFKEI